MNKHRVLGVAAGSVLAGVVLAGAVAASAQVSEKPKTEEQRTGVAHPDEGPIEATAEQPVVDTLKPSAAVPVAAAEGEAAATGTARNSVVADPGATAGTAATSGAATGIRTGQGAGTTAYGKYVPYTGAKGAAAAPTRALTEDEADAAVVTAVDDPRGALREGTLLHARVRERLTTLTTEEGTRFSAELVTPVEKDGRVVLPVGSVVSGRVTSVHGGKRISGKAAIHLEADTIQVPNGPRYTARMQVIDTDQMGQTKVDHEGSLVKRDHPKETAAVLGLSAGGGAAAGGVAAGPVGAVVGAGVGAGVGTVLWLKQDRQEVIPEHALLVFMLSREMPLSTRGETPEMAASRALRPVADPDAAVVGVQ